MKSLHLLIATILLHPPQQAQAQTTTPPPATTTTVPAGCPTITSTTTICPSTCTFPLCVILETLTAHCGCPDPPATAHKTFSCPTGLCDGASGGRPTAPVPCPTAYTVSWVSDCVGPSSSTTTTSTSTTTSTTGLSSSTSGSSLSSWSSGSSSSSSSSSSKSESSKSESETVSVSSSRTSSATPTPSPTGPVVSSGKRRVRMPRFGGWFW
ncbi:hypothetical protein QBC47DRAFT_383921 [Echria macrotheca]|uniref:Extracellular membrane protein CFEM domain-containing protein n=1 Tax=Echria macrotheca TaxID=438768 RepID=A0AAJ0BA03_9PEZI|nr:hypothetical protein QBC47DRAFT_383921 [Echria macrotheca]